jgi:hypothetical protein
MNDSFWGVTVPAQEFLLDLHMGSVGSGDRLHSHVCSVVNVSSYLPDHWMTGGSVYAQVGVLTE